LVPGGAARPEIGSIGSQKSPIGVDPAALDDVVGHWQALISPLVVAVQTLLEPVRADQAIDPVLFEPRRSPLVAGPLAAGHAALPVAVEGFHEEGVPLPG